MLFRSDKGFHGKLDHETVISQIHCLPENRDGRKIPFELINENPLPTLPDLLREVKLGGIELSQINLTLRADWFITGSKPFKEALSLADEQGVYVLLSSIGFESFDDNILRNLNKGVSVKKNIETIRLIRQLKEDFPRQLGYSTREGANHGFIHPTPWDTKETAATIQKNISHPATQGGGAGGPSKFGVKENAPIKTELTATPTHSTGQGLQDENRH